ncbi:MAG: indolepyruvate ferredoxin oxidoreductase subunit alpha [Clostridiales bacterium]|jgi:indolepyruvate ferredoxin oxidoreductase alpha subunit|nr:indolepyruvate ferredoxin oxidoreductase subunit alpha [Clostridiales bacterium]
MQNLLLANEAVARGAYEAGVKVISSYPGTPSTEITESAAKYSDMYVEWAPNEKVALETAIGASFAGVRAMSCMKHVGLNVAADPLFTVAYSGVNAGLVIVVADDPGMHSSQNEQDSRYYALSAHVPMLEPSDSQEAKDYIRKAYVISENYDTPVIVRLTTRIAHSRSYVELEDRIELETKIFKKDVSKYVMMPAMARGRHIKVEERENKLQADISNYNLNKIIMRDKKVGIVCAGNVYQYCKEATNASLFKLGMVYPIDVDAIKRFSQEVEELLVIEELEPFIENKLKAHGVKCRGKDVFGIQGEFSVAYIREKLYGEKSPKPERSIPVRPPVMCPGCPHRSVLYALKRLKLTVNGDIGCYTLGASEPISAVDACVCMGASIGMSHGFDKANPENSKKTISVIGDSTFVHSGITGLINAVYNKGCSTIMILDNSITGMTGHQDNPTTGKTILGEETHQLDLKTLCEACGASSVRIVDAYNIEEVKKVVKEELERPSVSVIIAKRPCALLLKKHSPPQKILEEKCRNCGMCLTIGCPALEKRNSGVAINRELCVGCKVCNQMCNFGAIVQGDANE